MSLSIYWIFWMLGGLIIGFLLAWIIRGGKVKDWKATSEEREAVLKSLQSTNSALVTNYEDLERNYNQLAAKNNLLAADLSTLQTKVQHQEIQLNVATTPVATTPLPVSKPEVVEVDNSYEIRAWETKYARLERDLAAKETELVKLQDENENYYTRLEVLESKMEAALQQKADALAQVQKHDSYKSRFEEANLERNTLKFKYDQLLLNKVEAKEEAMQIETDNSALFDEIESLKTALEIAKNQKEELQHKWAEAVSENSSSSKQYKDLKIMYDSMLGLQLRTEEKIKELQAQLAASSMP